MEIALEVLLITDQPDFTSVLPALELFAQDVHRSTLSEGMRGEHVQVDVAIIDGRPDLPAARRVCRRLAATSPAVAVVAVVSAADFVAVDLDWHFDDVVLAAAGAAELHARLRLASARRRSTFEETLLFGDLVLHPASYNASLPDRRLDLTCTEFKLLNYLVAHAGQAFTRTRLMHEVWGYECDRRARTVDVHVQRLRAKLGAGYDSLVDTVRGVGYMAVRPPQPHWVISEPGISPAPQAAAAAS